MDKLLEEGQYLTVFIPPTTKAFVFRVKAIANKDYPIINYGPLPLAYGELISSYEGGSVLVPADGVIPERSYNSDGRAFPMAGVYDETNMWYLPEEYRERLFHIIQGITPDFLRMDIQIPKGVNQARFQRDKLITGIHKDFGFARGMLEIVQFPRIHYGYRWGNDTNIKLRTFVRFTYGEYIVEIPKDSETIFNILVRKIPSKWLSMPIVVYEPAIRESFDKDYGFEGFPVMTMFEKEKAIREYDELLKEAKI